MTQIVAKRMTAQIEGPFVVFIIGMRVNRVRAVRKWPSVLTAMPAMLRELYAHPDLGFLGGQTILYWRGIGVIQYWRSFDHLEAYARGRDHLHMPAWQRFNKAVGTDGTVGIWHETYLVEAGQYETVYANMPTFGLAAASTLVPATGSRETARRRLRAATGEDACTSEGGKA